MTDTSGIDADLEGRVSPPRHNGEIVFGVPWERRLFGVTVALCRSGKCEWETFRQRLIRRIAQDETRPYWRSWAAALEDVLAGSSVITRAELDVRQRQVLKRPAGHDH
ncbi:MAG: nitrile hydratase subunit beta [Mycolicibacterium sp.]|nr:nitrile hydratase subunit beta [Mycolicibacterium sp.]